MIVIGRRSASQTGFTIPYHIPCITGAITWCIWFGRPTVYQCLPSSGSEFEPAAGDLYQSLPPRRTHNTQWIGLCVMWGYNGLELVVYGAVELGDVMLFFVGIHGLTGLEVYARLGWHFD